MASLILEHYLLSSGVLLLVMRVLLTPINHRGRFFSRLNAIVIVVYFIVHLSAGIIMRLCLR